MRKCALPWCGTEFVPLNKGGAPQRYCCEQHRRDHEVALRAHGKRLAAQASAADLKLAFDEQAGRRKRKLTRQNPENSEA